MPSKREPMTTEEFGSVSRSSWRFALPALLFLFVVPALSDAARGQDQGRLLGVPPAPELEQAREAVLEVFPSCRRKQGGEAAAELARLLLKRALETPDKPAIRYALMEFALKSAADAGDPGLVMSVVDQLDARYEVDRIDLAVEHLERATREAQHEDGCRHGVHQLVRVGEAAIRAGRGDVEERAFKAATAAAKGMKDALLAKGVEAVHGAFTRLAAAHEEAGLYFCVVERDWERGLGHLMEGRNLSLADMATRDVAAPDDVALMVPLADGWWGLREGAKKGSPEREAWEERAVYWYEQALAAGLKGFDVDKARQRLAEAQKLSEKGADSRDQPQRIAEVAIPPIPPHVANNIDALRNHRPRYVVDLKPELDAVITAAARGDRKRFRQAVDRAIEATRASKKKGETPGCPNCREDIILVLETIREGKWDLRSLRIHERDHRKNAWLTGLPGVKY